MAWLKNTFWHNAEQRQFDGKKMAMTSADKRETHVDDYSDDYGALLNLPDADAFEKQVKTYIEAQSPEWQEVNKDKIKHLKEEVDLFTKKLQNLPADTHPETVNIYATAEQTRVLGEIKKFDAAPSATTAPAAPSSTTAPAAPINPKTARAAAPSGTEDPTADSAEAPAATSIDPNAAKAAVDAIEKELEADDAPLQALKTGLEEIITTLHQAAQAERDHINHAASREAMKRHNQVECAKFFRANNLNPLTLVTTIYLNATGTAENTEQTETNIEASRKVMRERNQIQIEQTKIEAKINKIKPDLKSEQEKLTKAQDALGKAQDDPKATKGAIPKHEEQIKDAQTKIDKYNAEVNKLNAELDEQKKLAAEANQNMATTLHETKLQSMSGQPISAAINPNNNALTFQLKVPSTVWNPFENPNPLEHNSNMGYYVSSENNLSADLESLVLLMEDSGAKSIIIRVKHDDDKTQLLMGQLAWEKGVARFGEEKTKVVMGGKEITKENFMEILYKDKEAPNAGRALELAAAHRKTQQAVEAERTAQGKAPEAVEHQRTLRKELAADREALRNNPGAPLHTEQQAGAEQPVPQQAAPPQAAPTAPVAPGASAPFGTHRDPDQRPAGSTSENNINSPMHASPAEDAKPTPAETQQAPRAAAPPEAPHEAPPAASEAPPATVNDEHEPLIPTSQGSDSPEPKRNVDNDADATPNPMNPSGQG